MAGEAVLNVFVSSPGDVQAERERVDFVVERLNAEYKGRVRIKEIRWETSYYSSHDTFQAQIPEAADCDLVLGIFGARLGSPLPPSFPPMPTGGPYPSGTAYEVLSAIEARHRGKGIPDIYVFRRPRAPLVALDAADRAEIEAQWRQLSAFFETWFRNKSGEFIAAFQEFLTTDEFAAKVEDCLRQWLARRGYPARTAVWDRAKLGSPFPGLAAFDETRQSVFFGRGLVIEQSIRRLRETDATPIPEPSTPTGASEAAPAEAPRAPFLLLIGASGSGKSSLLRAGLMPRVGLPGVLPEVDLWRRCVTVPGPDPFLSLAENLLEPEALGPELGRGPFRSREILAKQLSGDPEAAVAVLRDALDTAAAERQREGNFDAPRPARVFIAVDQAERLLIETPGDLADRFAQLLAALCRHRAATVVMALRSDAYARFQALSALVGLRDAGATLDLLPATNSELEEMATRPAALCDPPLAFETRDGKSLATHLVEDARGGDALPLMQMTLARLSAAEAARGDGVMRFADYHGLGEAVTQTANEALAGLEAPARAQLANLIAGLVRDITPDPLTGQMTPVIGALDRTRFEAGSPDRKALVDAFVAKRLLTAEGDAASQRVRPTHESLLRIWPEAVAIIAEAAHLIRARHALEPIAREWAEAPDNEKAGHLEISPALLDGGQRYVERFGAEAPKITRDFIAAATQVAEARRDRERLEQERRLADAQAIAAANRRIAQRTGIGLVAALALAGAAGWLWHEAVVAQQYAQSQRERAEHSLALATATADGLVFDLAQKFRGMLGVPKSIIEDILEKARDLQEQLMASGESSGKLDSNHAAALAEMAITELSLGDAPKALQLAQQARDIFAKILAASPDNATFIHDVGFADENIGDIQLRQGHADEAEATYKTALDVIQTGLVRYPADSRLIHDKAQILESLGVIARGGKHLDAALQLFREALALSKPLAEAAPADVSMNNGLAIAYRNVGDVLLAMKDFDGAIEAFNAASVISERLARENPNDTVLLRDYTLSEERLGETLTAKQDYQGALKVYSDGEDTAIAMAAKDPGNLDWQYDISIGHMEVGGAQFSLGELPQAIESYREAVAIDKALTTHDPTNAVWRTHYWGALKALGDTLRKHQEAAAALGAYRDALDFARSVVARDSTNAEFRLYVVQSEDSVGDASFDLKDAEGALAAYRDAVSLARALAAEPNSSADVRDDLALGLIKLAGMLSFEQDETGAVKAYREAEGVLRALIATPTPPSNGAAKTAEDTKTPARRSELCIVLVNIANILRVEKPDGSAEPLYREAAALAAALADSTGERVSWEREEALALDGLGDALRQKSDAAGAIEAYRRTIELDDILIRENPTDASLRSREVFTYEAIGALLEGRKDNAGALAALRAALALRKELADQSPDDAQLRRLQWLDQFGVARLLGLTGDAKGSLAAYGEALAIARELAARPGADMTVRYNLLASLNQAGFALLLAGDWAGATADLSEGLELSEALSAKSPTMLQFKMDGWFAAVSLGDARNGAVDYAGALAAYLKGRDIAAGLVAGAPNDKNFAARLKLSVTKIGALANAMLLARDFNGALAALDQATPTTPDQNWFDLIRAACLMFLGRPDEARALYEKHRGEKTYDGLTWEEGAKKGFAMLRSKGLDNPLMAEIEATFDAAK